MIKKILKTIFNVFLVFVIVSAAVVTILTLTSKKDGIPNIFGYSPFSILTPSMEPTLKVGDIAICKHVDSNTELNKDDIIAFRTTIQGNKVIVTHRIVSITKLDDGTSVIATKGDNNDVSDANTITREDVVGIYTNKKFRLLGYVLEFIRNKWVFLFLVILPLAILFILELVELIKDFVQNEEIKRKEEEEKEKKKKEANKKKQEKKK